MSYSQEYHKRRLYRSRDGAIFGVCKGLAKYADISVCWVRCICIAIFIFSGFFPLALIYLVAAILMKPEPVISLATEEELEFYTSFASSRSMAVSRLKRKFEQLDRRARRIENIVTAKEFDWDQRLNRPSS